MSTTTGTARTAAGLRREMLELAERRDLAALRPLFHPEYVYAASDGVEQPGFEAALAVIELYTTAFPDLRFEIVHSHEYEVSDTVAIREFRATGSHDGPLGEVPPTGGRAQIWICNVLEARDGLIHREREYYDQLAIMRQLGVIDA